MVINSLNQRIGSLEQKLQSRPDSGQTDRSLTQKTPSVVENQKPRIETRTSLRFVPNLQDVGTDRLESIQLIIPDELIANNSYEITTIPPSTKCQLYIDDQLTQKQIVLKPTINKNQVFFALILPGGSYNVVLKNEDKICDQQEIFVKEQQFLSSPNAIGEVLERVVMHNLINDIPKRAYVALSQNDFQRFYFKVNRANCLVAFGITKDAGRRLNNFEMVTHNGLHLTKVKRSIVQKQTKLDYQAGDTVQVIIDDDKIKISKVGDAIQWEHVWDSDMKLFVEVADGEVVLQ